MEKARRIQEEVQRILGTDEVYLVGGSVRDIVMGNEPKDYDFTTPLTPEEMKVKVKAAGRRVYNIGRGEKHGTVTFKVPFEYYTVTPAESEVKKDLEEKHPTLYGKEGFTTAHTHIEWIFVEVTTHRTEVYDGKSRQPITTFGVSLDDDLARRDFTFNAMVLKNDGSIYDPYGGRLDILAKLIKTVNLPKDRIQEDPLRILRAARFAARYNFDIDPNFTGKARQLADRIYDVSVERWVMELDKLLTSQYAYKGMVELDKMGILRRILPEIYNGDGEPLIRDPSGNTDPDEAWAYLLKMSQEHVLGFGKGEKLTRYVNSGIAARLKFSNDRRDILAGTKKSDKTIDL